MPKALIIDDNEDVRHLLKSLLENVKINADEAKDGLEGVQYLKKNKYNIIFLDLKMPRLNGEQFMNVLKKRNDQCPVIVVSAYLTEEQIIRFIKLGVKAFLSKPLKLEKFYQEVNKICPIEIPNL